MMGENHIILSVYTDINQRCLLNFIKAISLEIKTLMKAITEA